jgi:Na+/H+ antiporter NhaD/arsenite permease-like protein
LLMTPMLLAVARRIGLRAEPLLIALATSSNVGSVMTLTGNPQNMLIGQSSHWTWGAYTLRMVPVGLICLAVNAAIVQWVYRRDLGDDHNDGASKQTAKDNADIQNRLGGEVHPRPSGQQENSNSAGSSNQDEAPREIDRKLAAKTVVVAVGLLVALCAGAPMDMAALVAATALLVTANRKPEDAFRAVDWSLLIFFAGLFVVVHGLVLTQGALLERLAPRMIDGAASTLGLARFAALSVVGSNLFSNVPFVMLLRPLVGNAPTASVIWLALAATSTFAGNLTLLGSVANLIVAQGAKDQSPLSFAAFLRVGVPTTIATTAIAVAAIAAFRALGWV